MYNVFDMGIMACEDVQAWVGSCKFGKDNGGSFEPAEVTDGAFVKLGDLADDKVYAGEKDWNVYKAYAPDATTYEAEDIAVIDLAEVMGGVIGGNYYKLNAKTVDLKAEADLPVRFRKVFKGDKFWLGAGCFASVPAIGKYAGLTANDTILTPADEKPANFGVVIRASKPLTQGNKVGYKDGAFVQAYLVEVL